MKIWQAVPSSWRNWFGSTEKNSPESPTSTISKDENDSRLQLIQDNLKQLLEDQRVPKKVRDALHNDFDQVNAMLDKLSQGHLHIAVFGRVSVGKSAMLNALLGKQVFSVSTLHGETKFANTQKWNEVESGGVYLIDTPGINEVNGEQREAMAKEVAGRADLVLFVLDADMTETEMSAIQFLYQQHRPMLIVLNKIDRYRQQEQQQLLTSIRQKLENIVAPEMVIPASAFPAERWVIHQDEAGNETESHYQPEPDIKKLKQQLWKIVEDEGNSLAVLNAGMFASQLSDDVATRIVSIRKEVAEKTIRAYCLGKGITVALNPVPVADIVAALAMDASMIVHLGKIYGMDITKGEARELIRTIGGQMALLMATVWTTNIASSALKGMSFGLTAIVTASAQGAVGWYSTWIVGLAAQRYYAQGKSWGESGPKQVVQDLLDSVDKESVLAMAREDISRRLKFAAD